MTTPNEINKTAIYLLVIGGFFISFLAVVILIALRPEASSVLVNFVGSLPALAGSVAAILYAQTKNGQKLETVAQQTNGTLSKLVDHATGTALLNTTEIATIAAKVQQQKEGK